MTIPHTPGHQENCNQKHEHKHATTMRKVAILVIAVISVPVLLAVSVAVKQPMFDPIYYPHQEKRFSRTVELRGKEAIVNIDVSNDSPDVTVTVISGNGSDQDSFHGVNKDFKATSNDQYTIVVKNDTDHWVRANVGDWAAASVG